MSSHWLPRLHSLVVGPGLGRDVAIHEFTRVRTREWESVLYLNAFLLL